MGFVHPLSPRCEEGQESRALFWFNLLPLGCPEALSLPFPDPEIPWSWTPTSSPAPGVRGPLQQEMLCSQPAGGVTDSPKEAAQSWKGSSVPHAHPEPLYCSSARPKLWHPSCPRRLPQHLHSHMQLFICCSESHRREQMRELRMGIWVLLMGLLRGSCLIPARGMHIKAHTRKDWASVHPLPQHLER